MFSKEMEALIEATLADGVLTDQEKTALINRAEKEGVDLNELEIYIQSILQKRQQELDKKSREALAQHEEADLESEKLRSKTLRVCPKCGTQIPHLSNSCPNCGFIIEKTELDEKLVVLIELMGYCIESLDYDGEKFVVNRYLDILKDEYNSQYKQFCAIWDTYGETYTLSIKYKAVIAEASLYKNNDRLKASLQKLHIIEKEKIVEYIEGRIELAKQELGEKIIYIPDYEGRISVAKKQISKLKSDYSDCINEINDIEEEIKKLEKEISELESSPDFKKRAFRDYDVVCKRRKGFGGNLREIISNLWDNIFGRFSLNKKYTKYLKHLWWIIPLLLILKFCSN